MENDKSPADMEIVPPERGIPTIRLGSISIPFTRKVRVGLSLVGIAVLWGPASWFFSQFSQARGIVDLTYSRLMLAGFWVMLSLACFIVTGQLWRMRVSIPVSLSASLLIVLWLDWWAPKPKTNTPQPLITANNRNPNGAIVPAPLPVISNQPTKTVSKKAEQNQVSYPYPWLHWGFVGNENTGNFQLHLIVREYPQTKGDVASLLWLEHLHITIDAPVAVNPNASGWWSCRVVDREEPMWDNLGDGDKPLGQVQFRNSPLLLEVVASAKGCNWIGKVIIVKRSDGKDFQWEQLVSGHITNDRHVSIPMSVIEKHQDGAAVTYKEGTKEDSFFSKGQLIKYGLPVKRLVASDLESICGSSKRWVYRFGFGPTKRLVIEDPFGEAKQQPVQSPK